VCLALALLSCIKVDPTLTLSTDTLDFGADLDRLAVVVQNTSHDKTLASGVAPLKFTFTRDQPWIRVEPVAGECGEGETSHHNVIIDRSVLEVGYNVGVITVSSNGGDRSVSVRAQRISSTCELPPTAPWNPTPLNDGVRVSVGVTLLWSDGISRCPDLLAAYDIYFGTTSPPPFHHDNGSEKMWKPSGLDRSTTYYWQVVARDANGTTPGAVWEFTTEAESCVLPPSAVALAAPANGAKDVPVQQDLSWSGGASQCTGLVATFDVYFGTVSPPPLDHNNATAQTWDPGELQSEKKYYWRVVARDGNGSTSSVERSFTTLTPCFAVPSEPCSPNPNDEKEKASDNSNLAWQCGDSQCAGLNATYDVYFGTDRVLGAGELLGNTASKAWDLPRLQKDTLYYWQIVAKDANGSRPGPVWSFRVRH
jgi:hypothetical protein